MLSVRTLAIVLASVSAAPIAWAQQPLSEGARAFYGAADFERFAPRTALDMVQQIPGFAIQDAQERRGLGQGGQNVLIDGQRPSTKAEDVVVALRRIPSSDVVRIEVVDAAALDIPGLSGQVANVVTSTTERRARGSFAWRPEHRPQLSEPSLLNGEISISGARGPLSYTLALANEQARTGGAGPERVFDPTGALVDVRDEYVQYDDDWPSLSATLRYEAASGAIANFNVAYGWYRFRAIEESPRLFLEPAPGHRVLREREDEENYEIAGDYEFGAGPGRLKVIALTRFDDSPFESAVVTDYAGAAPNVGSRFLRDSELRESILRAEYGWRGWASDWGLSAEAAFNALDSQSQLFVLDAGGAFVDAPLPGATATVEEARAEVNVTWRRTLGENLAVQTSLGAEFSDLSQRSDIGETQRSFFRPKGFLSLAYTASPDLSFRARIEREVGQLSFVDFLASVNLNAGNANAANPELVPPQTWRLELEATRGLGGYGTVTARAFTRLIDDIIDQIPIGADAEALGNLDQATVSGLDVTGTINFDPLGWAGARLNGRFQWQQSELTDPLTGERREISRSMRRSVDLDFRHDIAGTAWAWGVEYDQYRQSLGLRLDEVQYFVNRPAFFSLFVEHKDVFGLTVRGIVRNLLDAEEELDRTFFVNRRDGPAVAQEIRAREFGAIYGLTVTGAF